MRHAETEWNRERRVQGSNSDTELNELGRQQAENLASRLAGEQVHAVYSSPLQRAADTARAIASEHQLEVQVEPDLVEVNVGELEGVQRDLLGKRLDDLLIPQSEDEIEAGGSEGLWSRIPDIGGESLAGLQQRAWGAIQRIVQQYSDETIVVVSHYFVIMVIICAVINLPLSQIGRLRLGIASISVILFDKPAVRLTLFSDNSHLSAMGHRLG